MQEALALKGRWGVAVGLLEAAKNGQTDAMRCLARIGEGAAAANGSHGFDDNHTPLHYAARNNHCDTARALVNELGAPVNAADADRRTPLHWAAAKGHVDVMRVLVKELGATVDARTSHGWTPLYLAADRGHHEAVRVLGKELGADPNATAIKGSTALASALDFGHLETVRVLVGELGASVKLGRPIVEDGLHVGFEQTDLEDAARTGNDEIFCLIAKAAGPEGARAEGRNGLTAMHFAARWCGPPSLRALAALGADVNARCARQQTPLHLAVRRKRRLVPVVSSLGGNAREGLPPVVRCLIEELGADVDAKDDVDDTSLHAAVEVSNCNALCALLAAGASVDPVNSYGSTPLLRICTLVRDASCVEAQMNLMQMLLDNGADVPDDGALRTVLDDMIAAEQRHIENGGNGIFFSGVEEELSPARTLALFLAEELGVHSEVVRYSQAIDYVRSDGVVAQSDFESDSWLPN